MLEEEQISFRSASPMFDSVEDYSHQIAEMIGLRNESNLVKSGVSEMLNFAFELVCVLNYFVMFLFLFVAVSLPCALVLSE